MEQQPLAEPAVEWDALQKWKVHFRWAHRAVEAVEHMSTQNQKLRQSVFWTGNISCASSYSGVCAEFQAISMLEAAAKQAPWHPGFTAQCLSACEKDRDCQDLIRKLHAGDPGMHIYSDLMDLLPAGIRAEVEEVDVTHLYPWEESQGGWGI
jgi:hypothetical protein